MKKLTTLFTLAILTVYSFAQITITDADMPALNDTFVRSITTNIVGLNEATTGANWAWNFSALTPDAQRVDTFFAVTATPTDYQLFFNDIATYPNHKADYAVRGPNTGITQVPITEVFNFIKNKSSGFEIVGFGANVNAVQMSIQNNPIDIEYVFPMDYNDNHISLSEFDITVAGLGFYGQDAERIDTVDGWGSLTLPIGTFNVLRVKSIINKIDTIYINSIGFGIVTPQDQIVDYKWLAAGTGIPILKIQTVAGAITSIEYKDYLTVGIKEVSNLSHISIFPNPTQHHLVIDFKAKNAGNLKIRLKDVLGKDAGLIYTNNISTGNNKVLIDLAQHSIKKGIYFVEFSVDGEHVHSEKIVVVE